jgi:hypothetical protein
LDRVTAKERKIGEAGGVSSVPEMMAGKMERVMAKERKILSSQWR